MSIKEKILDAFEDGSELEKADKKLRHKPVRLYCLGCGRVISDNFTGGLWSYTCMCHSVIFGSKEFGVMLPSSIIGGYKSHSRCKECKSELEHIKRVLDGCLGKNWKKLNMPDKDSEELRKRAILQITVYSSEKYGEKIIELSKNHPEWKV